MISLLAINSFVRDGETFDLCVWACVTVLAQNMIPKMSFFLFRGLGLGPHTVDLECYTLLLKPVTFKVVPWSLLVRWWMLWGVDLQLCGRRCRVSAGCRANTVLLRCRPAGCGRPAKNPLPPGPGSSRSARHKHKHTRTILSILGETPLALDIFLLYHKFT